MRRARRFGEFSIRRLIGRGGMGEVYEAYQPSLQRSVALKILPGCLADDAESRARFTTEASVTAQLDHPNIVPIYSFGARGARCYFAMRLIRGFSLHELLRQWEPLQGLSDVCTADAAGTTGNQAPVGVPVIGHNAVRVATVVPPRSSFRLAPEDRDALAGLARSFCRNRVLFAASIGEQAARALAYAHGRGQIHRDVKLSNLMVDAYGHVYVIDFGLTHAISSSISRPRSGTLRYMSPEQLDLRALDGRTDIYSLGVTLYELVTGRSPFGSEDDVPALAERIRSGRSQPLGEHLPGAPRGLTRCIERMIDPDPGRRFQTAQEVGQALAALPLHPKAESPKPIAFIPGARRTPEVRGKSLRRVIALLALAPLAAGTAAAAVLLYRARPASTPHAESAAPVVSKDVPLNFWLDVLKQEPKILANQSCPLVTSLWVSPDRQQLKADCSEPLLIALGSIPGNGYKIRVGLYRSRWGDGPGIFFGYQPCVFDDGAAGYSFQSLRLRSFPQLAPPFKLERAAVRMRIGARNMPLFDYRSIAASPVEISTLGEQSLEIVVGQQGLLSVVWENQPLPGLCGDEVNAKESKESYAGSFGVFNGNGPITYLRPQVKLLWRNLR